MNISDLAFTMRALVELKEDQRQMAIRAEKAGIKYRIDWGKEISYTVNAYAYRAETGWFYDFPRMLLNLE